MIGDGSITILFLQIEQRIRLELSCVAQAMVVGDGQDYLAALLTLNTKKNEATGKMTSELTDGAKRWFRFARYAVHTFFQTKIMT